MTLKALAINSTTASGSVTIGGLLTPAAITVASTNNYNPGGTWPNGYGRLDLNPSTVDSTLTGLVAGADGQQVLITNIGTFNLILSIQDVLSTATNRFFGLGSSLAMLPNSRTYAVYSGSRWRIA